MRPNLNPSPAPSRPHYIYQPNRAQTTASSYTYVPTHQVLSKPRPTFGPASSRTLTPSRRGLPPPPRDVFLAPQPNKSSTSLSAPSVNGSARSANYVPSKFPRPQSVGLYRRRNHLLLKSGGGRDVFAHDQARMPDVGDEDYDGVDVGKTQRPRLRWNRFKWCLFLANLVVRGQPVIARIES